MMGFYTKMEMTSMNHLIFGLEINNSLIVACFIMSIFSFSLIYVGLSEVRRELRKHTVLLEDLREELQRKPGFI
jgi:hypothetical protein